MKIQGLLAQLLFLTLYLGSLRGVTIFHFIGEVGEEFYSLSKNEDLFSLYVEDGASKAVYTCELNKSQTAMHRFEVERSVKSLVFSSTTNNELLIDYMESTPRTPSLTPRSGSLIPAAFFRDDRLVSHKLNVLKGKIVLRSPRGGPLRRANSLSDQCRITHNSPVLGSVGLDNPAQISVEDIQAVAWESVIFDDQSVHLENKALDIVWQLLLMPGEVCSGVFISPQKKWMIAVYKKRDTTEAHYFLINLEALLREYQHQAKCYRCAKPLTDKRIIVYQDGNLFCPWWCLKAYLNADE